MRSRSTATGRSSIGRPGSWPAPAGRSIAAGPTPPTTRCSSTSPDTRRAAEARPVPALSGHPGRRASAASRPTTASRSTTTEAAAFGDSVGDWPAFPDSATPSAGSTSASGSASSRTAMTTSSPGPPARLGTEFDWVVTAQSAGSYKPNPHNFEVALERIGLPRERILHVAQSLFHDHVPAKALGFTTVWIDRRHDRPGSGATPPADATPDATFPDMASFARPRPPSSGRDRQAPDARPPAVRRPALARRGRAPARSARPARTRCPSRDDPSLAGRASRRRSGRPTRRRPPRRSPHRVALPDEEPDGDAFAMAAIDDRLGGRLPVGADLVDAPPIADHRAATAPRGSMTLTSRTSLPSPLGELECEVLGARRRRREVAGEQDRPDAAGSAREPTRVAVSVMFVRVGPRGHRVGSDFRPETERPTGGRSWSPSAVGPSPSRASPSTGRLRSMQADPPRPT